MASVDGQICRDIEYIVVDNGSSENLDGIMDVFLRTATIPVMYIKRTHGAGPHTGKRSAIDHARGRFLTMLDSDDELLPDAISTMLDAWDRIPLDCRGQYREVVAQCIDEHGCRVGDLFPEKLNHCTPGEAFRMWNSCKLAHEHVNLHLTSLLKEMPFPNPQGVTWVVDSVVLWNRLSKKYRTCFINDTLKRYYVGSPDSITNQQINNVTAQHLVNMLWAHKFELNHWDEYCYTWRDRLDRTLKVALYTRVLGRMGALPDFDWVKSSVSGRLNRFLVGLWGIPVFMGGASLFRAKKM